MAWRDRAMAYHDIGSKYITSGFIGEDSPRCVCQSAIKTFRLGRMGGVGLPTISHHQDKDAASWIKQIVPGGPFNFRYPIKNGIITNWDDMEKIMNSTYNQNGFRCDPVDRAVLLTERPLNPKANRTKLVEMMFETFKVPAIYIANSAVLALLGYYTSGDGPHYSNSAGLVFMSGDGVSFAVPIYEFHSLPHATLELEVCGSDLTDFLSRLMQTTSGYFLANHSVCEIKEKLCYIALDYKQELMDSRKGAPFQRSWKLRNSHTVTIGSECFQCPEALFQPAMLSSDKTPDGIHKVIHDSIMMCDADLHADLYRNIIPCGGNTFFPGFKRRLKKEIEALAPSTVQPEIHYSVYREYYTWLGPRYFWDIIEELCVSKSEYDENGASIFNKKCVLFN